MAFGMFWITYFIEQAQRIVYIKSYNIFLYSTNFLHLQPTDRAYLTITTVPSLENCKDCLKVAASYEEEGEGNK